MSPMIRSLYPPDWDEIALRVKEAANWHCEDCGKPCLKPGEDWLTFILRLNWTLKEALLSDYEHPVRHVLTTAHPNHDPENPEAELRAWCAPCHCRYDLKQIGRKRQLKREREGQLNLLEPLSAVHPTPAGHGKDPQRIQLPIKQEVSHE